MHHWLSELQQLHPAHHANMMISLAERVQDWPLNNENNPALFHYCTRQQCLFWSRQDCCIHVFLLQKSQSPPIICFTWLCKRPTMVCSGHGTFWDFNPSLDESSHDPFCTCILICLCCWGHHLLGDKHLQHTQKVTLDGCCMSCAISAESDVSTIWQRTQLHQEHKL